MNENIAFYLDTDKDFANFNAICRETHEAIQSRRFSAWRTRWKQKYDLPPGRTGRWLRAEYMQRRMYLYTKAFRNGHGAAEKNCIKTLKQLVTGKCEFSSVALTCFINCAFVSSHLV